MKNLELYYYTQCPFCRKVLRYIEKNSITVTLKNIHEDKEVYETLQRVGGSTQVPCLMIDGKPLYESNDIITWLEENSKKNERGDG